MFNLVSVEVLTSPESGITVCFRALERSDVFVCHKMPFEDVLVNALVLASWPSAPVWELVSVALDNVHRKLGLAVEREMTLLVGALEAGG